MRAFGAPTSQGIRIIGAIRKMDVPSLSGLEHVGGQAPVMSLPFGQFESNRPSDQTAGDHRPSHIPSTDKLPRTR